MSIELSARVRDHGGTDRSEPIRIQPISKRSEYSRRPLVWLVCGDEEKVYEVDAEQLLRAVHAAWEAVKPQ